MRVLLTGVTGYIGRRLMARLATEKEISLRLFVRNAAKLHPPSGPNIEVAEGSTFDRALLASALANVDTAYYLIHSLGAKGNFPELERRSAENFRETCLEVGVRRIIYLGGLGVKETASPHLRSRIETGEILSARPDKIQTLWFRAGIIIGSGSASFEIIRHLVQKLPVLITPRWILTRTQPIGVESVLDYLQQARTLPTGPSLVVDIGGEVMSFKDMLLRAATVMGLRRRIISLPLFTTKLSSYWLVLITPVPYRLAKELAEGLKSETIALNDLAAKLFPAIVPEPYERTISRALEEIETNQVVSRWCDSTTGEACDLDIQEKTSDAVYSDRRVFGLGSLAAEEVFRSIQSLGGHRGWLAFDWLWRIRGLLDKLAGGPGLNRGRRDPQELRIGDSLDFWKVQDVRKNQRLLLLAQMKVSGRAWLEFAIKGNSLVQTAYFLPRGLAGRLYWHSMRPAHALIFSQIAKKIIEAARKRAGGHRP